ncbi:MAG: AI-2E family transporter [Actinomycetota bacterium]
MKPYRVVAGATAVVMGMVLAVWLLVELKTLVIVVLVAGLLAAALERPVTWIHQRLGLKRRGAAVAIVVIGLLGALSAFGYLAYRPFSKESKTIRQGLAGQVERIKELPVVGPRLEGVDLKKETNDFLKRLPKTLTGNRTQILNTAKAALTDLAVAATTLVVMVFILLNGPKIGQGASALILDDMKRVRATRLARKMQGAIGGYVVGALLIATLAATVVAVSLLSMGVPFVAILAAVMFILDLLPLVGATIGGVLVTAAIFILDSQLWKAVAFAIIFIIYQQIENHTIYPLVMGKTVKIGSFTVLLVILAGTELAGVIGALLAIPIGSVLNVLVQDFLEERKGKAELARAADSSLLEMAGTARAEREETGKLSQ